MTDSRPAVERSKRKVAYDAFISYSHAADGKLAPALQNALQRFAKPWYRLRALHLFRDQTSLSASPGLWPSIEAALQSSRYFLLLASPEAASSRWVQQEVEWWLEHKSPETLLIALTDGTIVRHPGAKDFDWSETGTTALPPTLKGVFTENPLWVDFRWAKGAEHLSTKNPEFQNALAALAAPLRDIPKEDLIGEDVRQHRRALLLARGAAVVLVVLLIAAVAAALFARGQQVVAEVQRNEARLQRDEAQRQARIALARQLAAQAANSRTGGLDRRMLLGLEANRLQPDGPDIRGTMLTMFEDNAHLDTILQGLTGSGRDVIFSPDGTMIVVGSTDGSVRLYDRSRREFVDEPLALPNGISLTDLAMSPDGKLLAAGFASGRVQLWNLDDRLALEDIPASTESPIAPVQALDFSPDGMLLAVARYDNSIGLWNVERQEFDSSLPAGHVNSLDFSSTGALLASGGGDGPVILWDVDDRAPVAHFTAGHVQSLAFSPDGSLLAMGGHRNPVALWDVAAKTALGPPFGAAGNGDVWSVAFDPSGKLLASGHGGGVTMVWDVAERAPANEPWTAQTGEVVGVTFSPDGALLASSASSTPIVLWSVAPSSPVDQPLHVPMNHSLATELVFSSDSAYLAGGMADDLDPQRSAIMLWNLARPAEEPVTFRRNEVVWAVAFPDEETLAALYASGMVELWDVNQRVSIGEYQAFPTPPDSEGQPGEFTPELVWDRVHAVAFTPTGSLFAAVYGSGEIRLWDVTRRAAAGQYAAFPISGDNEILGLEFSQDGRLLAARYLSGTIRLWDLNQRTPAGELVGGPSGYGDQAFSQEGKLLAAGGESGPVQIWDVTNRSLAAQALTGMNGAYGISFSPDGTLLVTGGGDARIDPASASNGRIEIWDIAGRSVSEPLAIHPNDVRDVLWSHDGGLLVSAAWNTVVVSDLRYSTWEARVCGMVNRNLTHAEWSQFLGSEPYRKTCRDLPGADEIARAGATAIAQTQEIAQASALALAGEACPGQWGPLSIRVAGPLAGSLLHAEANNRIEDRFAGVNVQNAAIVARFSNPFDPALRSWDYGFFFRDSGVEKYSIYVDSNARWIADVSTRTGELKQLGSGAVENLDVSDGGANALCLVIAGELAHFAVNGVAVASVDVSTLTEPGDIGVATGFWYGREIDGRATRYDGFSVWDTIPVPVAGTPLARPSAGSTPVAGAGPP